MRNEPKQTRQLIEQTEGLYFEGFCYSAREDLKKTKKTAVSEILSPLCKLMALKGLAYRIDVPS